MSARACIQCGFDISRYDEKATICLGCREAAAQIKQCSDCGADFQKRYARQCYSCTLARNVYRVYASGQSLAISAVLKAQQSGLLPHPSACVCVDCGAQAAVHEHRDYEHPLDVVQVCKRCNVKRGMAKRKQWTFSEFWAYFQSIDASKTGVFSGLTYKHFEHIRAKYFKESA